MHIKKTPLFLLLIIVLSGLSACARLTGTPAATLTPTQPPVPPTDTPAPTSTPAPGKVVLVAPPEAGTQLAEDARGLLSDLAAEQGWTVETRPALQASELAPEMKVVVMLNVPGNLSELLAAAPQTQFAVVSPTDLQPGANLNVIRVRPEAQAFLAGYLATLIAPDWRAAGLLPQNDTLLLAFHDGGGYFCGICNPFYSPYVKFPLAVGMAANPDPAAWTPTLDEFGKTVVYVVYVAPESSTPELLTELAKRNVVLLGGGQTPPDEIKARWAATIRQDALGPLDQIWQDLAAGKGGQVVNAGLEVTDVRGEYLSAGRMRLVDDVRQKLVDGLINPLEVP